MTLPSARAAEMASIIKFSSTTVRAAPADSPPSVDLPSKRLPSENVWFCCNCRTKPENLERVQKSGILPRAKASHEKPPSTLRQDCPLCKSQSNFNSYSPFRLDEWQALPETKTSNFGNTTEFAPDITTRKWPYDDFKKRRHFSAEDEDASNETFRQSTVYMDVCMLLTALAGVLLMWTWGFLIPAKYGCLGEYPADAGHGGALSGIAIEGNGNVRPRTLALATAALAAPSTLMLGAFLTSTALSVWYTLHRGEQDQDIFLIVAMFAGAMGGHLLHLSKRDILLQVAPWCGIVALVLSSYGRKLIRCFAPGTREHFAEKMPVAGGFIANNKPFIESGVLSTQICLETRD